MKKAVIFFSTVGFLLILCFASCSQSVEKKQEGKLQTAQISPSSIEKTKDDTDNSSQENLTDSDSFTATTETTEQRYSDSLPLKEKPYFQPPKILGSSKLLDENSDPSLVAKIESQMQTILPSTTHGAAKWTVYVRNLENPEKMAYVTNWESAEGNNSQFAASTIKLFILIAVYQQFKDGRLDPASIYYLQEKDIVQGSGKMLQEELGTKYTMKDLCRLMITQSDNIATNVLIDQLGGFDEVNQVIAQLCGKNHQSSLQRKMMDTNQIENGYANRMNAKEGVETLIKLYNYQLVDEESCTEMQELFTQTNNKTKLPARLPAGARCLNKSGESNYRGIENDLAVICHRGVTFGIGVLIQLDGDGQVPEMATQNQTNSEINAIANLGQIITEWMINQ